MAYTTNRNQLALSTIAERMSQVVDPGMRARLTSEYLSLLEEYHRGRPGRDFDRRVEMLLSRSGFGRVHYKLTPALGTTNDRFFRAYADAARSLERLDRLAARQTNLELRQKWTWFLRDIGQRLTQLHDEAEIATNQAQLSRIDALSNETLSILAARLMPAEVEWARRLGQPVPAFQSRGNSGATSRQAYSDAYQPPAQVRPRTIEERQYPYARARMRQQPGQGTVTRRYFRQGKRTGLAGIFDDFTNLVTGAWDTAKGTAAAGAGETEAAFRDAVRRLAALKVRLDAQKTEIERLQAAGGDADRAMGDNWKSRLGRWENSRAELDGIAASMKAYSYDALDSASELLKNMLGQDEVAASTVPATWLLFHAQIAAAREKVTALEAESADFERRLSAAEAAAGLTSTLPAASLAVGGSLLALAAGAAALVYLGRKRRG